jgi:mannobiose 2-epimerase
VAGEAGHEATSMKRPRALTNAGARWVRRVGATASAAALALRRRRAARQPLPEDLAGWARAWEQLLRERALPAWLRVVDREQGGYRLGVERGERGPHARSRQLVSQARLVWSFARAHRAGLGGRRDDCERAALHGYRFLQRAFLDPVHGGYRWSADPAGRPLDERKLLYGQAFALYALVELHRASGAREPLERALELFAVLQERARDPVQGGWIEHFERDWSPARRGGAGVGVGEIGWKSSNAYLHLLEALGALGEVSADPRVRAAGTEALQLCERWFFPADPRQVAERRTPDWRRPDAPSPPLSLGHAVEFAWLRRRAQRAFGRVPDSAPLRAYLHRALAHGIHSHQGGLFTAIDAGGAVVDATRVWWVQAELLAALSEALGTAGGEARYRDALLQHLRYVWRWQIDPADGIWVAALDARGWPIDVSRSHAWKACYHELRAVLEFIAASRGCARAPHAPDAALSASARRA